VNASGVADPTTEVAMARIPGLERVNNILDGLPEQTDDPRNITNKRFSCCFVDRSFPRKSTWRPDGGSSISMPLKRPG
jgi:hypothetical protein